MPPPNDTGQPDSGKAKDAGKPSDAGKVTDAGRPTDAGSPKDSGTASDGGSSFDSGAASDSGMTGADAGPGTWCDEHPHPFCDDFDDAGRSAAMWTINGSFATIPLETASVVSAPNAFASTTPALAANAFATVQIQSVLRGSFGASAVQGHLEFDIRVQAGASTRTEIVRVQGTNPIDFRSYGFALVVTPVGASIELRPGSAAVTTTALATAPAQGVWTHVSIHLGLNVVVAQPTPITIQIGQGAPEVFSLSPGMGITPFAYLGAMVSGPADATEIDFDNVTYDSQ